MFEYRGWFVSVLGPVVAAALLAPSSAAAPRPASPDPTWRAIAHAPIVGRLDAGGVWTGTRMIVWGGVARTGTIRAVGDGAAYDPVTGSWRTIASAPKNVLGGGGQAAAWTGRTAVFWAGNSPDGPARGAVYDLGRSVGTGSPPDRSGRGRGIGRCGQVVSSSSSEGRAATVWRGPSARRSTLGNVAGVVSPA